MLTPAELERIPLSIQKLMIDLSMRIMTDVIDRLSMINSISRTADYEIYQLSRLGLSSDTIRKILESSLSKSDIEIDKIYNEIIKEGYARDESLYNATGRPFTRFEDNRPVQQLVEAIKRQTKQDMANISQTTSISVQGPNGVIAKSMENYFKEKVDQAITDIATGSFDYNKTIHNTIKEMTKSGVRTVEYEGGYSSRLEVAARKVIMTGVSQITNQINEMNAEALGTNHFEISWHSTARPTHQVWQGRVYSKEELETICGLGSVTGLCGANCYHSYYPFILGISKRLYTDEQLDEMNRKENELKEYKGKKYTTYEATQRQRQLETLMRKLRQDIQLGKNAGLPEDDITLDRVKYHAAMQEYVDFSKKMGLPQQRERIYSDGLGRMSNSNIKSKKITSGLKNAAGNSIIRVDNISLTGEPNSITQKVSAKGGIERNYYNESGKQYKQISNNNHGNTKKHPYGKNGEHAHDYSYDKDGNVKRSTRDLTNQEREENTDIL
ncbi:MAG: phage minor capsid protein [Anaerocolumna sp.]